MYLTCDPFAVCLDLDPFLTSARSLMIEFRSPSLSSVSWFTPSWDLLIKSPKQGMRGDRDAYDKLIKVQDGLLKVPAMKEGVVSNSF